jgi:hypothetical protein
MTYYITTTNDICNAEAVNLAYKQALQQAGNWYEDYDTAKKVLQEIKEINMKYKK